MTDLVAGANSGVQALKSATGAMGSLGGVSSSLITAVNTAAAMAQIFAAGASLYKAAVTARDAYNARAAAQAVALTATNTALGPVGWSKIAIALGAAAAASVATAAIMEYTLSADLESGDGRAGVVGAIGGIV